MFQPPYPRCRDNFSQAPAYNPGKWSGHDTPPAFKHHMLTMCAIFPSN